MKTTTLPFLTLTSSERRKLTQALISKEGRAFFADLKEALRTETWRRLIKGRMFNGEDCCTIGALVKYRRRHEKDAAVHDEYI